MSLALVWAVVLGCGSDPAEVNAVYPMSELRLFRRMSLDLRGYPPSAEELLAFEEDSSWSAQQWADVLLSSADFSRQVQDIYRGIYGLQTDYLLVNPAAFGHRTETSQIAFRHAVAEEPLHIIREVVERGAPWTEIVTADWTMANSILAQSFPLELNESGCSGL